ncbi:MAG: hypothetical protein HYY24_14855 [Verrucomicrobia bacterium]|nr:hypothetical protein [Verrucomicrobiota bacterium]
MQSKPRTRVSTDQLDALLARLPSWPDKAVGEHLTDEQTLAYFEERLDVTEVSLLDVHLEGCPECAARVAALFEAERFWQSEAGQAQISVFTDRLRKSLAKAAAELRPTQDRPAAENVWIEQASEQPMTSGSAERIPTKAPRRHIGRRSWFDQLISNARTSFRQLLLPAPDPVIVTSEMSRREFAYVSFSGLLAAPFFLSEAASPAGLMGEAIKGIHASHLKTTADEIVDAFFTAGTGELMSFYQLFFPTRLVGIENDDWDNNLAKIEAIQACCREKPELKERKGNWWRLRVLPAAAAAHLLSTVGRDESRELETLILRTHGEALNPNAAPNREVMEILWQNMTAAVIQSVRDWRRLTVSQELINAAAELCARFLAPGRETLPLLCPAVAAWQFLLTYERGLVARGDKTLIPGVRAAMARIRQTRSDRLRWLAELEELYDNRTTYAQMLPQTWENVMRRPYLKRAENMQAADYFVLLRIQMSHIHELLAREAISSPWQSEKERTNDLRTGSFGFLRNYKVTQEDWWSLKRSAENLLFVGGIAHAERRFQEVAPDLGINAPERPKAEELAKKVARVSFRKLQEANVMAEAVKNPRVVGIGRRLYAEAGDNVTEQLVAVQMLGVAVAAQIEGGGSDLPPTEAVRDVVVPLKAYQKALERVKDATG